MDSIFRLAINLGVRSRPGQKPDFGMGLTREQMTPWQRQTRRELTFKMRNFTGTAWQIANIINQGGTITTGHTGGSDCRYCPDKGRDCLGPQHRCNANFILAQHLGADFDNLISADQINDHELVKQFASIIYNTPSSTPQKPKMRVIFLMNKIVVDGAVYREMLEAMMWLFEGQADPSCKDYCRLLFGNQGSQPRVTGNILPLEVAMQWREDYLASRPKPAGLPDNVKLISRPYSANASELERRKEAFARAVLNRACEKIRAAGEGARHHTLTEQAFHVFTFVKGGVIDRYTAEQVLLTAYPAFGRGDGPAILAWAYENAPAQGLPDDQVIRLDFSQKTTKPALNFNRKPAYPITILRSGAAS